MYLTIFPLLLSTLRTQLSVVQDERSALQAEVQSLKEQLIRGDPPDSAGTITNKKLLLLQSQMEQLQEENYRSELPQEPVSAHVLFALWGTSKTL